jgi:hypothetical protein
MAFRKSNDFSDLTYNSEKSYGSQCVALSEGEGGRHRVLASYVRDRIKGKERKERNIKMEKK